MDKSVVFVSCVVVASMEALGARADGRAAADSRPVRVRPGGCAAGALGSAYAEACGAKALCSVRGPAAPADEHGSILARGVLEVGVEVAAWAGGGGGDDAWAGGGGGGGGGGDGGGGASRGSRDAAEARRRGEASLAGALRRALAPAVLASEFPKVALRLDVLLLEADGPPLPALVAAACAALVDARVPLGDLVAAATVARVGAALMVDPTAKEAAQASATAQLALQPSTGGVTAWELRGVWSDEQAEAARQAAHTAAAHLDEELRTQLREAIAAAHARQQDQQ